MSLSFVCAFLMLVCAVHEFVSVFVLFWVGCVVFKLFLSVCVVRGLVFVFVWFFVLF